MSWRGTREPPLAAPVAVALPSAAGLTGCGTPTVGASVASGDHDNDGWSDLCVTSSRKGSPTSL